jgi:hypothetical protein
MRILRASSIAVPSRRTTHRTYYPKETWRDCNLHKGSNIAGFDPQTSLISQLYHPRKLKWEDHFEWQGITILGKTAIGRATVDVLCLNSEEQLHLRLEILG